MSHEEIDYLNGLTKPARERACRRAQLIGYAVQWGGWALALLMLMANIAVQAG